MICHHCVLAQERGFDIELGEFGLAVGAQVFVAETAHDLVVAIDTRHHQQLLEQLRRLRQRKELAGMGAAGHQVIARAFRRGLGQHRRFDFPETLGCPDNGADSVVTWWRKRIRCCISSRRKSI